jgi:hypothetical protein
MRLNPEKNYYPWMKYLATERNCVAALETYSWGKPARGRQIPPRLSCPFCSSRRATNINRRKVPNLYQCNDCRKKFNVLTRTPIARTRRGVQKWFLAYWYRDTLERQWREAGLGSKREARRLQMGLAELDAKYGPNFLQKVRRAYLGLTKKTDRELDREFETTGKIPFGYVFIRDKH